MKYILKIMSGMFLIIFIMLVLLGLDLCLLEDYTRGAFFFVGSFLAFFLMAIFGYLGVNIE